MWHLTLKSWGQGIQWANLLQNTVKSPNCFLRIVTRPCLSTFLNPTIFVKHCCIKLRKGYLNIRVIDLCEICNTGLYMPNMKFLSWIVKKLLRKFTVFAMGKQIEIQNLDKPKLNFPLNGENIQLLYYVCSIWLGRKNSTGRNFTDKQTI